jgi:broad specificity phosphatase PhoE
MVKPQKQKRVQRAKLGEIELVPDAWARFERFIREVVKAGPQHRAPPKRKRKVVSHGGGT